MTSLFTCPNCKNGIVDIVRKPVECDSCRTCVDQDQLESLQSLETQLRDYIRSLIECIDDCAHESGDTLDQLFDLITDPPGVASLAACNSFRSDLRIIRSKFFLLKNDLISAKREFTC